LKPQITPSFWLLVIGASADPYFAMEYAMTQG
jgi:hypothetical protein